MSVGVDSPVTDLVPGSHDLKVAGVGEFARDLFEQTYLFLTNALQCGRFE